MKASIVILNWNGKTHLEHFMPSVVKYCAANCEVVVADNGSTDDSVAYLKQHFPDVRLIQFSENYGFAEGYNRALEQIQTEYVVLLNSDVELTEDFLSPMLAYMDAHPDVAAAQPKILAQYDLPNAERNVANAIIRFEHAGAAGGYMDRLGYPYCRGRVMGVLEEDHGQYDTPIACFWASGCCLLMRTHIYKELGGLNPVFFAHMEEIDLCWRVQRAGYKVMCLPETKVYHLGGGALPYESPHKVFLNFRNCLLMLHQNLPLAERLWLMPLRWGLDMVASLQYLLTGKPQAALAVLRARADFHRLKAQSAQHGHNICSERGSSTTCSRPAATGRFPFSILLHFYLLGHRKYSDILQEK